MEKKFTKLFDGVKENLEYFLCNFDFTLIPLWKTIGITPQ
jgi:hypothetical protein